MNQPIKSNPLCLSGTRHTGISEIYPIIFSKNHLISIEAGLRIKRISQTIGVTFFSNNFESKVTGEYYNSFLPVDNSTEHFDIKLYSANKYIGLCYTLKYFFSIKSFEGMFFQNKMIIGFNSNAIYEKTYYQLSSGYYSYFYTGTEVKEIVPYKTLSYSIDLSLGYNQNIWNGIQLSAYSGISYRFISIYYHFGLGLNYKISLPKKKKE